MKPTLLSNLPAVGWLRLPSGAFVNASLAVRVELVTYDDGSPAPGVFIHWTGGNYDRLGEQDAAALLRHLEKIATAI